MVKKRMKTRKKASKRKAPSRKRAVSKKSVKRRTVTRSKARVIKVLPQHGRSVKRFDRLVHAKKPGVRISAEGNRYTETRANRSDVNFRKRL